MGASRLIRKTIAGQDYFYDRVHDVVYRGDYQYRHPYDRTQVNTPVDLCIELTTFCNMTCRNCFSNSAESQAGVHAVWPGVLAYIRECADQLIRVCVTGGEPMLHPDIESVLRLPEEMQDCGFVLSTNGTPRPDLDEVLINQGWLVAISLHGTKDAHNVYTASGSFDKVVSRIHKLARILVVHIYTVLHEKMTRKDLLWLFRFRDEAGVAFLRFMTPRPFGRYEPLRDLGLIQEVACMLDERSGLKTDPSLTHFISVNREHRRTH